VTNKPGESKSAETNAATRPAAGDDALPGTPGTGENVCPECSGSGRHGNKPCPHCGGTGKVIEGIGGA
jgi:DnaJ-class molecular chaperone